MAKKKKQDTLRYKNKAFLLALGENCRRLRVQKGYSIDRMYKEGDKLSPGAIQRLETGSSDVHVSLLFRFSEVLGIPVKKLFEFETGPNHSEKIESLITPYESDAQRPAQSVPFYSLSIAAGMLQDQSEAAIPEGWVQLRRRGSLEGYFAAVVKGRSMEPTIPSGSLCLFKRYTGGTRQGQIMLIQARGLSDPESGGRFVVKRYHRITSVSETQDRSFVTVELRSDNKEFAPIELHKKSEEDISTPALFVEVIQQP